MFSEYKQYLTLLRDSLIQNGVGVDASDIDLENAIGMGDLIDGLLYFYRVLSTASSGYALSSYPIDLSSCYLSAYREVCYREFLEFLEGYKKISTSFLLNNPNLVDFQEPEEEEFCLFEESIEEDSTYLYQDAKDVQEPVTCLRQEQGTFIEDILLTEESAEYSPIGVYIEDIDVAKEVVQPEVAGTEEHGVYVEDIDVEVQESILDEGIEHSADEDDSMAYSEDEDDGIEYEEEGGIEYAEDEDALGYSGDEDDIEYEEDDGIEYSEDASGIEYEEDEDALGYSGDEDGIEYEEDDGIEYSEDASGIEYEEEGIEYLNEEDDIEYAEDSDDGIEYPDDWGDGIEYSDDEDDGIEYVEDSDEDDSIEYAKDDGIEYSEEDDGIEYGEDTDEGIEYSDDEDDNGMSYEDSPKMALSDDIESQQSIEDVYDLSDTLQDITTSLWYGGKKALLKGIKRLKE